MSADAVVRPSSLPRVAACAGSQQLSVGQPNISSPAADLGTMLHDQADLAIQGKPFTEELPPEHLGLIQPYIDYCKNLQRVSDFSETERLVKIIGDICKGTVDFTAIVGATLTIVDLKTGSMPVSPRTLQLKAYALGTLKEFDIIGIEHVNLVIIQPQVSDQPLIHRTTPDELWAFEKELEQIIADAEAEKPKFTTGSHCRWCNASAICVAAFDEATEMTTSDVAQMSLESVGVAYAKTKFIKGWVKSVEDRAKHDLLAGVKVPGFKLVAGKRPRSWKTEGVDIEWRLDEIFADKSFVKKYLSVAQAEKLLGGKTEFAGSELSEFVEVAEGQATIAKDSDKRPALLLETFKDETKNER
jgi:hypothetical protein